MLHYTNQINCFCLTASVLYHSLHAIKHYHIQAQDKQLLEVKI